MEKKIGIKTFVVLALELLMIVALVKLRWFPDEPMVFGRVENYQVSDHSEEVTFYLNGKPITYSAEEYEYNVKMDSRSGTLILPCGKSLEDAWTVITTPYAGVSLSEERIFLAEVEMDGKEDVIYMQKIRFKGNLGLNAKITLAKYGVPKIVVTFD